MLAFKAVIALVFVTLRLGDAKKDYKGYQLLTVVPESQKQVDLLNELQGETSLEIDIWNNVVEIGREADILVGPETLGKLRKILKKNGMKPIVKVEDMSEIVKEDEAERSAMKAYHAATGSGIRGYDLYKYQSYERIVRYLKDVASQYPNLAQVIVLKDRSGREAKTHEGRKLYVLKVGSKGANKPAYWIDSGIHAREWAATALTPYIINELTSKYASDKGIKKLVDKVDFYIMPLVNPDGYEFSRTEERFWRKNRRDNGRGPKCFGVDLNRNFDSVFGGAGTSPDPCNIIYRGPSAFSEPESDAMRVFLPTIKQNLKAFVTAHAYSQMWFYPYAYERGQESANAQEVRSLANKAAGALANVYGTRFTVGTPANILYAATGGSMDWVKDAVGTKYVFGLELRPGPQARNGFVLPENQIKEMAEETWAGLKVVAEELASPGGTNTGGTRPSSSCVNKHNSCDSYARYGYCRSYQTWMFENCAKACRRC